VQLWWLHGWTEYRCLQLNQLGLEIVRVLAGAWREPAGPEDSRGEIGHHDLRLIWPLLARSGAIGLLWHRLKSGVRATDAVDSIKHCYFQQLLDSRRHEQALEQVLALMHASGIRPLLVKGWAIARHYPAPGLRPYTDIDLSVPEEQLEAAARVLERIGELALVVDLHRGFPRARGRDPAEITRRQERVPLGRVEVDVLGLEDHLRHLCLHLLEHGAWRIIWLCDVALLLDTKKDEIDWGWLLAGDPRDTDAVLCAIGLAHHVLGVSLEGTPAAERASRIPRWMVNAVLESWGRGEGPHPQLWSLPRNPRELWNAARERWPNPIAATASLGAPYNDFPRFPIQVADYVLRTVKLMRRL
jgi:hypothetical protein